MFSFRQRIFFSYLILFILFIGFTIPFASTTVKKIATKAMHDRALELIEKIQSAPNNDALIRRLKEQKSLIFFRVSVITNERKVLYDSHTKRLLGPRFSQEYVVDHPEVLAAFDKGTGYAEDYSELLGQKFSYFAKAFDFHGNSYVLRIAFPYKYVVEVTHDFEMGIIALATSILLLFSAMTWFTINYLAKPISQIINAIIPYSEGQQTNLPEVKISKASSEEFSMLASTLNSLSAKLQKQLNNLTNERNEKQAILESLVEGVIAVDQNRHITYANKSSINLLKLEKEIIGKPITSLPQKKCIDILYNCQKEQKILLDTLVLEEKPQKIYLDLVAAPKQDGGGAILVLLDKTTHYRLLEMRKDFVANASHELKTPITIIRGFAETLHDHPELNAETTREITEKIVRNCKRMTNLIKDLLTLSDIENIPESRLEECDLTKIMETCKEMVLNVHPTASIKIEESPQKVSPIIGDPRLLELAFLNLIENAAKYSTPPADISITLQENPNDILITIEDKGIGIPAPDLEHIFEKFYTVNKAYSMKMGGSGLGLAIVKTIVDKHLGHITVESTLGKGSIFTIQLPKLTPMG